MEQSDEPSMKGTSVRRSAKYQYTGALVGAELTDAKVSEDGGPMVKDGMATPWRRSGRK